MHDPDRDHDQRERGADEAGVRCGRQADCHSLNGMIDGYARNGGKDYVFQIMCRRLS
jgi:hypothetical protein